MEISRTLSAVLCAATLLAFTTACGDTETEWVTAPTISASQAVVTVPDEGGTVTVGLTITNPVDGATISASPSASWVTVTSCTETSVGLSASENPNADPRTARVTVSYPYSVAGTKGTASCEITVAQSCGDQPAISVQPTAVAAAVEGGSYSFEYTIVNPAPDGQVSASCPASWIADLDCSAEGTVGFGVSENTTTSLRQAEITLSYSWGNGSISESVTVVQDHEGGSGDDGGDGDGSIVGTYTVSGYTYDGDMTWTMTIHRDSSDPDKYWIDGLTPSDEGNYAYGTGYCAYGRYGGASTFVVPSQISASWTSSGYYIGWTPCTEYDGTYWYFGDDTAMYPDLTFTMKDSSTWVSDYGVFLGAFADKSFADEESFGGFFDVVAPSLTITKVSDDPDGGDGGSGGGGGGDDDGSLAGTYTAHGTVKGQGFSDLTETTWTLRLYKYAGSASGYDYYIDGILPWMEDSHTDYGWNGCASAYVNSDGELVIPMQVLGLTVTSNNTKYYLGVVACASVSPSLTYSTNDIVLTKSGDNWVGNYGPLLGGFTTTSVSSYAKNAFQYASPDDFYITKVSDDTDYTPNGMSTLSSPTMSLEDLEAYTNLKMAPASASSPVTRGLGPVRQGDAKLAR